MCRDAGRSTKVGTITFCSNHCSAISAPRTPWRPLPLRYEMFAGLPPPSRKLAPLLVASHCPLQLFPAKSELKMSKMDLVQLACHPSAHNHRLHAGSSLLGEWRPETCLKNSALSSECFSMQRAGQGNRPQVDEVPLRVHTAGTPYPSTELQAMCHILFFLIDVLACACTC